MTVITCEDSISSPEIREEVLSEACAATGSEREDTFFVTNYTHDHKEFSLTAEQQTLDILYSVLRTSEQFVKSQKLCRKSRTNYNSAPSRPAGQLKLLFLNLQQCRRHPSALFVFFRPLKCNIFCFYFPYLSLYV